MPIEAVIGDKAVLFLGIILSLQQPLYFP